MLSVGAGTRGVRLVHVVTVEDTLLFFQGQVGFMRARGVEPTMVCAPGPYAAEFERRNGVPVVGVAMERRITPLRDLVALWRIWRVLRRVRPDIVHAHTPKGGLLGTLAGWLARVPVRVYHIRGLPAQAASGMRRRLLMATDAVSCRLAHRVLCVSASVRDAAVAEGLCPAAKVRVLGRGTGNGVDAEGRFDPARLAGAGAAVRARFGIPPGAPVLLYVGRIVRDKGMEELAAAWRELAGEDGGLHLLLVGKLERENAAPPEAVALFREHPRAHMAGQDEDVAPYYAAADVVVFPTYREGFPNVPLEAAAMAVPVVATSVSGCVDAVVHGETGLLVPPRDAGALAAAVRAYLGDPALRARHGARARERVLECFRPADVWAALHAEYARLLEARGRVCAPSAAPRRADPSGARGALR
jgi:glycosyltransferase involved in cell wall biosynthesis